VTRKLTPATLSLEDDEAARVARDHVARQRRILEEIVAERDAQDALFGVQDIPDGTGRDQFRVLADAHRLECDTAFAIGTGTYRHVFVEEVYEALAESDPVKLRAEMVQVVAVGVKWLEAIDRREGR
jgi:hypothetical protein